MDCRTTPSGQCSRIAADASRSNASASMCARVSVLLAWCALTKSSRGCSNTTGAVSRSPSRRKPRPAPGRDHVVRHVPRVRRIARDHLGKRGVPWPRLAAELHTASTAPGASAAASRGIRTSWSIQCRLSPPTAIAYGGSRAASSARATCHRMFDAMPPGSDFAISIIGAARSMASMRSTRCPSGRAMLPVPHPRSSTVRGPAGISDRRMSNTCSGYVGRSR